jgi:histone arginine demethylase JMJD6
MATATTEPRTHSAATGGLQTVDRRSNLSYAEFVHDYRNPGRPVIFTDLTRDWSALGKFTPEFLRAQCGDRTVTIRGKAFRLADFLDLLENSSPEQPAPYPCKLDLRGLFADLAADVAPRPGLTLPDRTHSHLLPRRFLAGLADLEIFIGGPGGEFPYLHYDYLGFYAYINQLYGEKEFFIYPPGQEHLLYVDEMRGWISRVDNAFRPDLEKFPLFAQATPITVVLRPGETLFIPCGIWHTARSRTVSISVAFDQLCRSNWRFYSREVRRIMYPSPGKSAIVGAMLTAIGTALTAWERLTGSR